MAETPDVDIIIPTWNRRALVTAAVQSALAQEGPRTRVTVVDDGGTDGTAAALRARFGGRIAVLEKPNGGLSSARNHGLAATSASLVSFLDDDDLLLPGKVAVQARFLAGHPEYDGCVGGGYLRTHPGGHTELVEVPDCAMECAMLLAQNPGPPLAFLWRREAILRAGGFDETLPSVEDWDLWLRCARVGRVHGVPHRGYVYELRAGNMSRDHERMLACTTAVFDRHAGHVRLTDRERRRLRCRHRVKFVRRFYDAGDDARAAALFRECLAESEYALRLLPAGYLRRFLRLTALPPGLAGLAPGSARHALRAALRQFAAGDAPGGRRILRALTGLAPVRAPRP